MDICRKTLKFIICFLLDENKILVLGISYSLIFFFFYVLNGSCVCVCVCSQPLQLCLFVTLWTVRLLSMEFSRQGHSMGCHALLQESSQPIFCVSCRWILYHWAIQEAQCLVITIQNLASYCISIGFPCLLPVPLQLTEPLVPCEGGLYTQVGWSWPYSIHASGTALVSETGPWLRPDPQRDVLVSVLWRVSLSPEGVFEAIGDIVWTPGSIQSWSQYERIYVSIYFNKAKLD